MSWFDPVVITTITQTLGWTLLHFFWQGALLGLIYYALMAAMGQAAPRVRYHLGLGVFALMALAPVATFIYLLEPMAMPAGAQLLPSMTVAAGNSGTEAAWGVAWAMALEPYLPWAVGAWCLGVILMSTRVSWDWWQVRRLTCTQVQTLPEAWQARVAGLKDSLGISRPVRVLRSGRVIVPAVVGWWRPVILLPAAALAGMDRRQLEMIITHELAHIRRCDYLVNLFQVIVETLLFYHPVVRWVSEGVRADRELCCDDEVVAVCGDPLTYARALTELETQRQQSFQLAMAASGGSLSCRIHRMLERPLPRRGVVAWGISLMLGLTVASVAVAAQLALRPPTSAAPQIELIAPTAFPATTEPAVRTSPPDQPVAANLPSGNAPSVTTPSVTTPDPKPLASQATPRDVKPEALETELPEPAVHQDAPELVVAQLPSETLTSNPTLSEPEQAVPSSDPVVPEKVEPLSPVPGNTPKQREGNRVVGAVSDAPASSQEPLRLAKVSAPAALTMDLKPVLTGGRPIILGAPDYPRRARLRGLEGMVVAEFTINARGRVGAIEIVRSEPAGVFNYAVRDAVSQWRFEPLQRNGEALERRVSKTFEFTLEGVRSHNSDDCNPVTGTRICGGYAALPGS